MQATTCVIDNHVSHFVFCVAHIQDVSFKLHCPYPHVGSTDLIFLTECERGKAEYVYKIEPAMEQSLFL